MRRKLPKKLTIDPHPSRNPRIPQEEVEEVQQKLAKAEADNGGPLQRMVSRICTPVFYEALILTFLAGARPLLHRPFAQPDSQRCIAPP